MSDIVVEETPLPTYEDVLSALESGDPISERPEEPKEAEEAPEAVEESEEEVEEPEAAAEEAEEAEEAPEEAPEEPEEAVEAPAVPPDVADRLERVAAAERALSAQRREFDQERARIQQEQAEIEAARKRYEEAEAWIRSLEEGDPLAALEARGISFEQLADGVATGRGVRPTRQLEERLERQERQIQEWQQAQERARAEAEQRARENAAREEVASQIEERSPILAAMGPEGIEMVLTLARETVAQTGRVPEYDTLFETAHQRVFSFLDRLKDVEAVRERILPKDSKQSPKRAASKTVSNRQAGTPAKQKKDVVDVTELPDEEAFDVLFGNGIPSVA